MVTEPPKPQLLGTVALSFKATGGCGAGVIMMGLDEPKPTRVPQLSRTRQVIIQPDEIPDGVKVVVAAIGLAKVPGQLLVHSYV